MKAALIAIVMSMLASAATAQQAAAPPAAVRPSAASSNPEMLRLFKEDQADRQAGLSIDWKVVGPRDEARREKTRRLLADGALHTAEDYRAAAFIFQHGSSPDDYLLAHTLAMVAVAKGDPNSLWIASATLDRYLINTGHRQIYGTQYSKPSSTAAWTLEPYDRTLISDPLRRELGVPDQAAQQKRLEEMQTGADPRRRP